MLLRLGCAVHRVGISVVFHLCARASLLEIVGPLAVVVPRCCYVTKAPFGKVIREFWAFWLGALLVLGTESRQRVILEEGATNLEITEVACIKILGLNFDASLRVIQSLMLCAFNVRSCMDLLLNRFVQLIHVFHLNALMSCDWLDGYHGTHFFG